MKNHPKKCLNCQNGFLAKNIRAVYCSDRCRVADNRRKSVSVTQKRPILPPSPEMQVNEKKKERDLMIVSLQEMDERTKRLALEKQKIEDRVRELTKRRNDLKLKHGKPIEIGVFVGMRMDFGNTSDKNSLPVFLGGKADKTFNTQSEIYNHSKEIATLDAQVNTLKSNSQKSNDLSFLSKFFLEGKITDIENDIEKIEEVIEKAKRSRTLNQIEDATGFVSAKDIQYLDFAQRFTLDGSMGTFLGALDRNKLAITLMGKPGSGKTYFTFDLSSHFIKAGFTVACFSLEEGITELLKEKLKVYNLETATDFKIRDSGNINDVRVAAKLFDVVVIDSWGKLKAPVEEFDKLRWEFPKTIFVSIFQQTTSGQMRGGTTPAFDAGINIETFKDDENRFAVCSKNRYGMTGIKYGIDKKSLVE